MSFVRLAGKKTWNWSTSGESTQHHTTDRGFAEGGGVFSLSFDIMCIYISLTFPDESTKTSVQLAPVCRSTCLKNLTINS